MHRSIQRRRLLLHSCGCCNRVWRGAAAALHGDPNLARASHAMCILIISLLAPLLLAQTLLLIRPLLHSLILIVLLLLPVMLLLIMQATCCTSWIAAADPTTVSYLTLTLTQRTLCDR